MGLGVGDGGAWGEVKGRRGDGQSVYQRCLREAFIGSGLGNAGYPKCGGMLLTTSQFQTTVGGPWWEQGCVGLTVTSWMAQESQVEPTFIGAKARSCCITADP